MNVFYPPVWIDQPDDSCGTMISFCLDPGDPGTTSKGAAPGSFQWYEQDSGDDLADEILAWASAEEAVLPVARAGV